MAIDLNKLVGLPEQEAIDRLVEAGFTIRIAMRDGDSMPVHMQHNPGRVSLTIDHGIVVDYILG